jgi:hypothetical protein
MTLKNDADPDPASKNDADPDPVSKNDLEVPDPDLMYNTARNSDNDSIFDKMPTQGGFRVWLSW